MRIRKLFSRLENNRQNNCFRHLCPSSHPYAKTARLIGGSSVKFHMRNFHWICRHIAYKFSCKSDKNNGYFTLRPVYTECTKSIVSIRCHMKSRKLLTILNSWLAETVLFKITKQQERYAVFSVRYEPRMKI
jgi:hypothetical protein